MIDCRLPVKQSTLRGNDLMSTKLTDINRRTPRLFIQQPLASERNVWLNREQVHYITTVLRLKSGDSVKIFNGVDGEWLATVNRQDKRSAVLSITDQLRSQPGQPDIDFLFAPLKQARLDYVIQKAVEMGASRIIPVMTRHTQVTRINSERMRANAIEGAEQCDILHVPAIGDAISFSALLANWDSARTLIVCDEALKPESPLATLKSIRKGPLALFVGPEGGFANDEQSALTRYPKIVRLSLGPRILRADTAAVAALALLQVTCGDWR